MILPLGPCTSSKEKARVGRRDSDEPGAWGREWRQHFPGKRMTVTGWGPSLANEADSRRMWGPGTWHFVIIIIFLMRKTWRGLSRSLFSVCECEMDKGEWNGPHL